MRAWVLLGLVGCYHLQPSNGGGQVTPPAERPLDVAAVAVPDGYVVEIVATGLDLPTGVAFDDAGGVYVLEAGYSYGELFLTPRIAAVRRDGSVATVVTGEHAPWNGFVWHDGAFLVAQGGVEGGGRIVRFTGNGEPEVLADGLPGLGDHHTNGPAVGDDGYVYFGQGTFTNSAVVGPDNADFGWLRRHPDLHDIPCEDVELAGLDFESDDVLRPQVRARVRTGAFVPFGTPTRGGQVIPGQVPCSGAILRVPQEGGEVELVAWGLRNPFGVTFAPDGTLYATDNAFDARGSRPVFGASDWLRRIEPGSWHGWPDFEGDRRLDDPRFRAPGEDPPGLVLAHHPGTPPAPVARFGVHSSANGFDFARHPDFGGPDTAYVALFGDLAPEVGKVLSPVGFQVVQVDVETGVIRSFMANHGDKRGPATWLGTAGIERPVAARFDPTGRHLYVVDFGIMATSEAGVFPQPGTGVLWRIRREGA